MKPQVIVYLEEFAEMQKEQEPQQHSVCEFCMQLVCDVLQELTEQHFYSTQGT
jgi:hypothetical protein